jgi:hypothetical protein
VRPGALLLGAVLLLAACGGSDGADGPPPSTVAPQPTSAGGAPVSCTADAGSARRWIAPEGTGDGSTKDRPASLAKLDALVAQLGRGGEVLLAPGDYDVRAPVVLAHGGTATAPVVVRSDGGAVTLRGNRPAPWAEGKPPGPDLLHLDRGAGHLRFQGLDVRDVGNAFFVQADAPDLCITGSRATNVRRFFDTTAAKGSTASVTGLGIVDVTVDGFSKVAVRVRYDSSAVLLQDVTGDSQRQDGDDFAIGVHLDDTAHDVSLRRVTMRNAQDTRDPGDYWNGDGFATERGNHDIRFETAEATGNSDAGFDIKSTRTVLTDVRSADNKRNFRFWAADTRCERCTATAPVRRGGSGIAAQVQLNPDARVTLVDTTLQGTTAPAAVYELDAGAVLTRERVAVMGSVDPRQDAIGKGAKLAGD